MSDSPGHYPVIGYLERHHFFTQVLVALAYVGIGVLILRYATVEGSVALVWPPSGIALAAVVLFGMRVWPAVMAGACIVTILTGAPLTFALTTAVGNTLEAVAGAYFLRHAAGFNWDMGRVKDVLGFLLFAVAIATMLGSTIGVAGLCANGLAPWSDAARLWRIWWMGDAIGVLIVGSFLLAWSVRSTQKWHMWRRVEAAGVMAIFFPVMVVVHGGTLQLEISHSLSFVSFPFVIWGALRFSQKGATLTAALAIAYAVWGSVQGVGPFSSETSGLTMVFLHGYTASLAVTGMLIGAAITERRRATHQLQRAGHELEDRVEERTAALREELTRRSRAQEALRASEERYRHITQCITDYIYTVTFSGGMPVTTQHGHACVVITGHTSEELAADPYLWITMVHASDRARVLEQTRSIISMREPLAVEHRIWRKDGALRWVRNTMVPRWDTHGILTSYDGLIQDITVEKSAQEAIRESEARFRAVFEFGGLGMALTDLHGTIQQANSALEHILGYGPHELEGKTLKDITHPEDYVREMDHIAASLASGVDQTFKTEKRYLHKDKSLVWGRLTATFLRDGESRIICGLGMVEDISETKASEEERERLVRELQDALARVKTLSGLLPICSSCKKIRDDRGYWTQVEGYLTEHTQAQFSHGICPDCLTKLYPEYAEKNTIGNGQEHSSENQGSTSTRSEPG